MSANTESIFANTFPSRVRSWKLRTRTLPLGDRPCVMGILNVTPDSFSDGGKFISPEDAVEQGLRLVEQGADILDIGGESTRPYSESISASEELARVIPVISALSEKIKVPISIDTTKAAVAREAIAAGAEILNDITSLEGDPQMIDVACETKVGICAMHMQGTPQTMQDNPTYENIVEDIFGYLRERRDGLLHSGIDRENICLDPGVGFGKTHEHNLTLLAGCWRYHELGCPVLVGHSRKGFIGKVLGDKETDRTAGTVGASMSLARQGVQILRVHDVAAVRDALLLFEASGGLKCAPFDGRK